MRALLALLMGCAPTKKTAPDSDASTEPSDRAPQEVAKPTNKRGAGTVPQAVKQATEVSTPQHLLALDEEWGYESLEETVWLWRKSPSDYWKYFKGSELEAVQEISDGAIGLIRASWLVNLFDDGGRIEKRQSLPPEAFVSLKEIKSAGILEIPLKGGLRIIVLSLRWLHPDHPDPRRAQLSRVAHVLRAFIEADKACGRSGVFGVVWDYMSLHQSPRNEVEEEAFRRALPALNVVYAHPYTRALMLTAMPADWPSAYDLPETANAAQYFDSGWCFGEWGMATLVKNRRFVLDLGVLDQACLTRIEQRPVSSYVGLVELCTQGSAKRRPPLLPTEFTIALDQRTFTNRRDDSLRVSGLYERAFRLELGRIDKLYLFGLEWDDDAAEQFAKVIHSGVCRCLQWADLNANHISNRGAQKIADAARDQLAPGAVICLVDNPCSQAFHWIQVGEGKTLVR